MSIWLAVLTHACTCTCCAHVRIHLRVHVHVYVEAHVRVHVRVHVHVRIRVCVHLRIRVHLRANWTRMNACTIVLVDTISLHRDGGVLTQPPLLLSEFWIAGLSKYSVSHSTKFRTMDVGLSGPWRMQWAMHKTASVNIYVNKSCSI